MAVSAGAVVCQNFKSGGSALIWQIFCGLLCLQALLLAMASNLISAMDVTKLRTRLSTLTLLVFHSGFLYDLSPHVTAQENGLPTCQITSWEDAFSHFCTL